MTGMAATASLPARKRDVQCRTKVKTGCATCRTRKVKCDETKPCCKRCTDTGRTCDGYESPFRFFANQPRPSRPLQITPRDIDLLHRCFSTKTMFDVDLRCDEEAKQVLEASLTDPSLRHAVSSLRALRHHLDTSGDVVASATSRNPRLDYGLEQYCMALGGAALNLSSPGPKELHSALLCCQVFISIEQVRGNFATMAQHIVQGLMIMHEHRVRPTFGATGQFVPASHGQLPFLDVFVIKIFAAPCKFRDQQAVSYWTSNPQQSGNHRTIAPNKRGELERVSTSTLEFLAKVSKSSTTDASQLLSEKRALLGSLVSWLNDLEDGLNPLDPEPLPVSFMRMFHRILKIILLGALESLPNLHNELQTENDQLLNIARFVAERFEDYKRKRVALQADGMC